MQRKVLEDSFAARGQFQQDFTAVVAAPVPANKACGFQAVHQFDSAVVLNLQALGQFTDPGTDSRGEPLQGQQKLMLARFKAGIAGCALAKPQKTADIVAKLG